MRVGEHRANVLFQMQYKGAPNLMTPAIIERGMKCVLAWELSGGRGLKGEPIYGVTVLEDKHTYAVTRDDLSTLFYSEADAREHIKNLEPEKGDD